MKMINDMRNVLEMDDMAGQAAIFSGKESARADSFRSVVHGYFDTMIKSGYSQPQEFEADTQALKLLAEAGYSPGKLTEVLRTLQSIQKEYSGSIFSTHPALNERITNVERQIIIYKMTDNSDMRKERFYRIMRHDTRQ
jgi:predicted Zn-dependent protease